MDDRPINYPVVVRGSFYLVREHYGSAGNTPGHPYSGLLHTTRWRAASEQRVAQAAVAGDPGLAWWTYTIDHLTEVYHLRCCTCGEIPPGSRRVVLDWDDAKRDIWEFHHTWVTTSELTIFCPHHVNDTDYA